MGFDGGGGFRSTNRAPAMAHKRSMERKSQAGGAGPTGGGMSQQSDPLAQPTDEQGGEDGAQVAAEHGPATEVHVMHNHEANEHHVQSMHPDGHQHQSQHGSVDEAHEHGKKLAGGEGGEEHQMGQGEEPEYE